MPSPPENLLAFVVRLGMLIASLWGCYACDSESAPANDRRGVERYQSIETLLDDMVAARLAFIELAIDSEARTSLELAYTTALDHVVAYGPGILPSLVEIVAKDGDEQRRLCAAFCIAQFGDQAVTETPQLVALLNVSDPPELQVVILRVIRRLNDFDLTWAESLVPYLAKSLSSSEPLLCDEAALILGGLGSKSEAAVPDLIRTMNDPGIGLNCRRFAVRALKAIEPDSQRVREAMQRGLDDPAIAITVRRALGKPESDRE